MVIQKCPLESVAVELLKGDCLHHNLIIDHLNTIKKRKLCLGNENHWVRLTPCLLLTPCCNRIEHATFSLLEWLLELSLDRRSMKIHILVNFI